MTVLQETRPTEEFVVVHPLYDEAEVKFDGANLGLMQLTPTVRACLVLLRVYLVIAGLALTYHLLDQAGVFHSTK